MAPLLQAVNLTKRFGGLTAVDSVSQDVNAGEVIGLVGDNGAGKSTFIKMIAGVFQPDDGELYFEGRKVELSGPRDARDMGIETIYQDLALAENLDVGSNIFLGREIKKRHLGGLIKTLNRSKMREESASVLSRLDIVIPSLTQQIRNLSGGQRQSVAIARTIYWNAKLVIMDEPTAALGVAQSGLVLRYIAQAAREQGIGVTPICPLFIAYFEKHPEEADLVRTGRERRPGASSRDVEP